MDICPEGMRAVTSLPQPRARQPGATTTNPRQAAGQLVPRWRHTPAGATAILPNARLGLVI